MENRLTREKSGRVPRLLVFIVAYNAEKTIHNVLNRIPPSLSFLYDVEVLVIDDSSRDKTFDVAHQLKREKSFGFPLHVLVNPENQGYGGNQKIGYHYAIENSFDFVALVHGDGQYAPECLPDLVAPLYACEAEAVFGSRMLRAGAARGGGMPIYKFVGNKFLSWFENLMLGTNLSEFHSGYRVYAVKALKAIPFDLNTNNFHFDTEIIIQLIRAGLRIKELPIPTYYGDEICRVNGVKYAANVALSVLKARAQDMSLFYDRRYDCMPNAMSNKHYKHKLDFPSPHSEVMKRIQPGTQVLDLGCAGGYVASRLSDQLGCQVTGTDVFPLDHGIRLKHFIMHDLNKGLPDIDLDRFKYILLLDVIEHLSDPEGFVEAIRQALKYKPDIKLFVSSGNVAFIVTRLMLFFGHFNYGKRGILDITHSRLFTLSSLVRLFEQGGFKLVATKGIPAPFPLALGNCLLSRLLLRLNDVLIAVWPGLFSYQSFCVFEPHQSLEYLLIRADRESTNRLTIEKQNEAVPIHN